MRFPAVLPALALLLALAGAAAAHTLWIETEGDSLVLRSGHLRPGEAPDLHGYGADFVREALCFDEAGRADTLALDGAAPFRAPGGCAALVVHASSGYWTKTPYGMKNLPRDEVEHPIRSGLSLSYVKRILRWSPAMSRPLTEGLEIVPLADPAALRPGESLEAALFFGGEPVAGAEVFLDGERIGTTGPEGRVAVALPGPGIRPLSAKRIEPVESEKTDRIVREAILVLEAGTDR